MVEASVSLLFLEVREIFLEVLDGDAARCAAAGDARHIRRVQAQFVHARFHARRHVAGASGVRRDRQAAHGRFHAVTFG